MREAISLFWFNWFSRFYAAWHFRRLWIAEGMPGHRKFRDHLGAKMTHADMAWANQEASRIQMTPEWRAMNPRR